MYGNRTICGIGRGDSAVRVTNGTADDAGHAARVRSTSSASWPTAGRSTTRASTLRFPWGRDSRLEVWVAAYGPKALALTGEVGDGYILQLADPDIAAWMIKAVREAAEEAGRDPAAVKFCVAAPAYVGDDLAHQRDQTRWFGGMVGNHVADIVARYGDDGGRAAGAHRLHQGPRRATTTPSTAGPATRTPTFVPDEIVDRFCMLGPVEAHVERLARAARRSGVDQFAVYLQHDAKEDTLRAYGEHIIPAVADQVQAKT